MILYIVALANAPKGDPEKSQFFLLCVATHKRNYAEFNVMRSEEDKSNTYNTNLILCK